MKFSIFSNDKSTATDEIILTVCILVAIALGLILVLTKPTIWFISATNSTVFGVICILTGVMFIPSVIYRFATNNKEATKNN